MMTSEKTVLCELAQRLKQEGFADIRFYIERTERVGVGVLDGKRDSATRAKESAYFVEAGKDGKRCCTFFNTLDGMDDVVEQMQISASASQEDYQPLPAFEQEVSYHSDFAPADELEAIKVLAEAESKAREEKRIAAISNCRYNHSWKEVVLMDENGTCMTDSTQVASVSIGVVSREDGDTEIAHGGRSAASLAQIDVNALAKEVAQLGAQRLHAKPLESGRYAVILQNSAAAELLEAYLPIFYASEMQNKMSKLAGKQGEQIACADLELIEDPELPTGRVHRHFDDEGCPVSKKYLIHGGKLESVLYNRRSAAKEEKSGSGNGFKANIQSSVGTGVTNVALQSASGSYLSMEQLCEKMGSGIIVTDLEGVFAGVNTINGSFSLLSKGMLVENGKPVKPFCEVTIAGNIYTMLEEIEALGDDPAPTAAGSQFVQTPSILLKGLTVSGL